MKVGNAAAQILTIFSLLTLGSLMIIVALHLLAFEDAILRLQEIYQNPWRSAQVGLVGLVFIVLGLAFSKMLIKSGRPNEALIFHSDAGPVVVSSRTIKNVAMKALKRITMVKNVKVKINISGKDVEVKLRLVLWSGGRVPEILAELQQEVQMRVKRLLGPENQVTVTCDVKGVEETEAVFSEDAAASK